MNNLSEYTLNVETSISIPPSVGPAKAKLKLDGERVLSGELEVGYLHRGIEKTAERVTWQSFFPYIEKVDYLSSIHCTLAYAQAVEALAGISVPQRAQFIRVITSELNRIASHLYWLSQFSFTAGAGAAFHCALRDREKLNNLFELLCGARLTYNYIRLGGVSCDLTDGFIERATEFIQYFSNKRKEYDELLSNNPTFKDRFLGLGKISSDQAIGSGVSGPNLRACGIAQDLRRDRPYAAYQEIDFEISLGRSETPGIGDCFDRYLTRMREIEQSLKIVKQSFMKMPEGDFQTTIPRIFKVPKGRAYSAVEGSRGSFGVFIESHGEKTPHRVKIKAPSQAILNIVPTILKGSSFSDVSSILWSLDISTSEVDR